MTTQELSPSDLAEIERLEEAMWQQTTRYDPDFQESRFSQDFFEFGRSGRVYSRHQIIVKQGHPIHAKLPLPELQMRLLDTNTVQVTYNSAVIHDGMTEYARRSSIWSRNSTGWIMRFHQGTPYVPA